MQNRSIEVSRIAATPATVVLLRDTFERRLIAQSRQLEVLDEQRRVAAQRALREVSLASLDVSALAADPLVVPVAGTSLSHRIEAALVRSGIGIRQLPFDRGRGLRDGLDAALWTVPELFFASIRKGTSEYVLPELRPPPG